MRSRRELEVESLMQKEAYRYSLAQQISEKRSKKNEETHQKLIEKVLLDESVKKFQEEQMHFISMMKRNCQKGLAVNSSEKDSKSDCCGDISDEHCSMCSNCKKLLPIQALSKFSS